MDNHRQPRLIRQLGLLQSLVIALSAMIGAGIYVTIGVAAAKTGASVLLAVLIAAAVAALNSRCATALAIRFPQAGGTYLYAKELLGPGPAFAAGCLYLIAGCAAGAVLTRTFAGYSATVLPTLSPQVAGLIAIAAATAVQTRGIRLSAKATMGLALVNTAILIMVVAVLLPAFEPTRLQPFLSHGALGLAQASAMLFFAFAGFERPAALVEEIRAPARTLPPATYLAIALVTILYGAVVLSTLGAAGPAALAHSATPLRAALLQQHAERAAAVISLGAMVAAFTVILVHVLGLSRTVLAMARCRELPGWLCHLSGPLAIPRRAVAAVGALMALASVSLDLSQALATASLALLLYFGMMSLCALRLARTGPGLSTVVPTAALIADTLLALLLPAEAFLTLTVTALLLTATFRWCVRAPEPPPPRDGAGQDRA